jgi:hypothetical protein
MVRRAVVLSALAALVCPAIAAPAAAQSAVPTLAAPVLVSSCGQSPGPLKLTVFLKRLGIAYEFKADATDKDVAGKRFKSLIVVTGASLKGMGAAGVSMKDELARTTALIEAARKAGVFVAGAHIEGMARRSQGAEAGDNSDEQSIDAVCPKSQLLIIRKDGDEDGRFSTIARTRRLPMVGFDKNLELEGVLKTLFGK